LYLLAREILLLKGVIKNYKEFNYKIEDFMKKEVKIIEEKVK